MAETLYFYIRLDSLYRERGHTSPCSLGAIISIRDWPTSACSILADEVSGLGVPFILLAVANPPCLAPGPGPAIYNDFVIGPHNDPCWVHGWQLR